jgi:hypothetical protein
MPNTTLLAAVADAAAPTPTVDVSTSPNVSAAADLAKAYVDAATEARASERSRIKAIIGNEEAKGREPLAHQLAFATDMEPAAAIDLLKVSAKAEPPKTSTRLDALVPDPKVGAGGSAPSPEEAASAGLAAAVDTMIKALT